MYNVIFYELILVFTFYYVGFNFSWKFVILSFKLELDSKAFLIITS